MIRKFLAYSSFMAVAAPLLLADFTYQETSTITGGAMAGMLKIAGVFSKQAREPIQSTISVKGDQMVHRSATHASVIDLKSETITSIDMQKKQYSVMTFAEMKQALEQMQERMEKANKKGNQKDTSDPQAQMKFKVSAKATGNKKQVAGFEAKEMVLKMEMEGTDTKSGQTGAMVITTDMWLAPGIAGYREVREFYRRMGEKLNWTPGGNMFAANPQVSQGMAEVYKEVAKVDGVPVQQIITMGASGTAPAAADGSAPPPPPPDQQPQQQSAGSALGSAIGGHFGLGKKKPADSQQQSQSNGQASGSLLEMTTELGSFSSAPADSSLFSVPAGFKKVEPDMKRAR